MKLFLTSSAVIYLVALWVCADAWRDGFLSKAKEEAASAYDIVEWIDFARDCPGPSGCRPDLEGFVSRAAVGRRFVWLSGESVPLPSYRTPGDCEKEEGEDCLAPLKGNSEVRFVTVSACNPRIVACN